MFLVISILLAITLAIFIKWRFSYWKRQGFPYLEAKNIFGVLDSVRSRKRSFGMALYDTYVNSTKPLLGVYLSVRPALLVRDAKLVRDIMVKDFPSFHDRGTYVDEVNDPISANLFFLRGQKWKNLRTKLTSSFTSGKLKGMMETSEDVCNKMVQYLNKLIPETGSVEVSTKEVLSTYAIDIIGSVIFGLDVDSFQNPDNEFRSISKKLNEPNFASVLRGTCQFLFPGLEKVFIRLGWKEEAKELMRELVRYTIENREKNHIVRKDMLQLLLQLRNSDNVNGDDNIWTLNTTSAGLQTMSTDNIAAQLFLFYVAGFETTASTAAFTLYELAQYPEILAKVLTDIEETLKNHNGKLTYDALHEMKYLELCVMETVRKYPALPILNRECTQDFDVPNSNWTIKKGTPILISLFGMHRDETYFPDPLRYDPERFQEDNKRYDPVAYMPFGAGPRHCIANRMGSVNVKLAVATILMNFNIEIQKERRELKISNYSIPIVAEGGVPVRMSRKK